MASAAGLKRRGQPAPRHSPSASAADNMQTLLVTLLLVAAALAGPQGLAYYSPGVSAPGVVLVPAGSTANLASVQQVPVVVVGGRPLLLRDEGAEAPSQPPTSIIDTIFGFLPNLPSLPSFSPEAPVAPAEEKPSKVETPEDMKKPAENLETLDEGVAPAAMPEQKFVLLGQPQFFGNYGNYEALHRLGVKNLHNKGALPPGVLFVRGGQPHFGGKPLPEPEKVQEGRPGAAALQFQRVLQHQQAVQNVQRLVTRAQQQDDAVVVDAYRTKQGDSVDAEDIEANPAGPSVSQVRPQAIAMAGAGGVAAAAPLGTALVGPGGVAVSSPQATAVAGPSGGSPPVVPASFKALYQARLQELLREQVPQVYQPSKKTFVAYNA